MKDFQKSKALQVCRMLVSLDEKVSDNSDTSKVLEELDRIIKAARECVSAKGLSCR